MPQASKLECCQVAMAMASDRRILPLGPGARLHNHDLKLQKSQTVPNPGFLLCIQSIPHGHECGHNETRSEITGLGDCRIMPVPTRAAAASKPL